MHAHGERDASLVGDLREVELVAFDLDGTLLPSDKCITERTVRAIRQASAAGITLVPATGRVASVVPHELLELPEIHFAICSAGASVEAITRGALGIHDLPGSMPGPICPDSRPVTTTTLSPIRVWALHTCAPLTSG